MSWHTQQGDMPVLAVVPARGGSKGVARKNMRRLGGTTLVGRAASLAASLTWCDAALVSTDDAEIAAEAVRHGIDAPFLRPTELANDTANSADMWRHAWLAAEEYFGRRFETSILLEPTSPLRTAADIELTLAAMLDGDHDSAATVSPTPAHYTPHKSLTRNAANQIGYFLRDGARFARRQEIAARLYHRNGICYAARRRALVERREIIGADCAAVIIDRPVVNIDEEFDFELAEWLLQRQTARDGESGVPEIVRSAQKA